MLELVEAWNSRDVEAWLDRAPADLVFRPDPSFPDSAWMSGDAIRRWLREWYSTWEGDRLEVIEGPKLHGEATTGRCRWHLTPHQTETDVPVGDFTVVAWLGDDGEPRRIAAFFDHEQAL